MCSSVLGIIAMGFRGPYVAAKFALEGYSDALRIELSGAGISVSVIEPGPIRTNFTRTALAHARKSIDIEHSVHVDYYRRRLRSMERGGNTFGERGPEAVLKPLIHACESPHPRPNYFVTRPAPAMGFLKRALPKSALHRFLSWATVRGER
jgi:NAD(P)-dependent dehydrogenase (short-subunit alcohol dehydrogenase family)